jgi:hemerythrin superfamily protein
MDAIELLTQQHEEVDELFEKFEKAIEKRDDSVMDLFVRIADNLAAHAVIEEKIFYPSVYVGPTADKLAEAVEEHLSV